MEVNRNEGQRGYQKQGSRGDVLAKSLLTPLGVAQRK